MYRIFIALFIVSLCSFAQQPSRSLPLPEPERSGGKPLMQALNERKSTREFSETKLDQQQLSNLLWAAWGVNRPDGRRTAPSSRNRQEISIYLFQEEGVYLYEAQTHSLRWIVGQDLRKLTGTQPFVATAPLNLVYVADLTKIGTNLTEDAYISLGADCGFIAQNVYLYCASSGLATVVRAMVNREELAKALNLGATKRILLAQTIGWPKE